MEWRRAGRGRLRALLVIPVTLLLPLVACESGDPVDDETTVAIQPEGETMEIDNQVRLHIPEGWEAQTGDFPGLGVFVATLVPEGTEPDALMPGRDRVDFAHLTLKNIGVTNGAEAYVDAQQERDSSNSDYYSDIAGLDPVEIDGKTFFGYEGTLSSNGRVGPIQYWYGEAGSDTYKFEIYGETDSDIPQELIDAMRAVEFLD